MQENLKWYHFKVCRKDREDKLNQKGKCFLLTGLSCSGKSTIANAIEFFLHKKNYSTYLLDGDNTRIGINSDLSFTNEDRSENLRRVAEIAKLFVDSGMIVICSFIAPTNKDREMIKKIIGEDDYVEIYVNASLETCMKRDVKGLYKKAINGEIKNFTGVDSPYEIPENPFYIVDTENDDIDTCLLKLSYPVLRQVQRLFFKDKNSK